MKALYGNTHCTLANNIVLRVRLRVRLRLRLGGGVVGSVLVATPGSVHSTCIELQLLIGLGLDLG